eukprot:Phypoly_transcript_02161.p1 GENE.Phypoly_transcript_02161~~Phypoly_transcript_02161.p1  ORF type:complete len:573 (+),score=201.90 Phypoly_transcript_02161:1175-2893(+)
MRKREEAKRKLAEEEERDKRKAEALRKEKEREREAEKKKEMRDREIQVDLLKAEDKTQKEEEGNEGEQKEEGKEEKSIEEKEDKRKEEEEQKIARERELMLLVEQMSAQVPVPSADVGVMLAGNEGETEEGEREDDRRYEEDVRVRQEESETEQEVEEEEWISKWRGDAKSPNGKTNKQKGGKKNKKKQSEEGKGDEERYEEETSKTKKNKKNKKKEKSKEKGEGDVGKRFGKTDEGAVGLLLDEENVDSLLEMFRFSTSSNAANFVPPTLFKSPAKVPTKNSTNTSSPQRSRSLTASPSSPSTPPARARSSSPKRPTPKSKNQAVSPSIAPYLKPKKRKSEEFDDHFDDDEQNNSYYDDNNNNNNNNNNNKNSPNYKPLKKQSKTSKYAPTITSTSTTSSHFLPNDNFDDNDDRNDDNTDDTTPSQTSKKGKSKGLKLNTNKSRTGGFVPLKTGKKRKFTEGQENAAIKDTKALSIASVAGAIIAFDNKLYKVVSQADNGRSYIVDSYFRTCDCMDFTLRRRALAGEARKCKHIRAVEIFREHTSATPAFDDPPSSTPLLLTNGDQDQDQD